MRRKLLTLLVAALLLSPLPALAQIGQTATLAGTVTDTTGAVLPGATVTVASDARSSAVGWSGRGVSRTMLELTLGGGVNAAGGRSNRRSTRHKRRAMTASRP